MNPLLNQHITFDEVKRIAIFNPKKKDVGFLPKISVMIVSTQAMRAGEPDNLLAVACTQEGEILATHVSSTDYWAYSDMGITRLNHKHTAYQEEYPEGYRVVFEEGDVVNTQPYMCVVANLSRQAAGLKK